MFLKQRPVLHEQTPALGACCGEILSGANDLAEYTTKRAAAIEETSAAMEQLAITGQAFRGRRWLSILFSQGAEEGFLGDFHGA